MATGESRRNGEHAWLNEINGRPRALTFTFRDGILPADEYALALFHVDVRDVLLLPVK